jgi:hypothetical protein
VVLAMHIVPGLLTLVADALLAEAQPVGSITAGPTTTTVYYTPQA